MRILWIIIQVVAVIWFVLYIAFIIFIRTFDINKHKPKIERTLSETLGRDVAIGQLSFQFSFDKGLNLNAENFSIQDILVTQNSHIHIDVKKYIQSREILMNRIELDSPEFVLINSNKPGEDQQKLKSSEQKSLLPLTGKKNPQISKITIKEVKLKDWSFIYIDRAGEKPWKLPLRGKEINIQNFSLDHPLTLEFDSFLFSLSSALKTKFIFSYQPALNRINVSDLSVDYDLKNLRMDHLIENIPQLQSIGLKQLNQGVIKFTVDEFVWDGQKMATILGKGSFTDGKLQIKDVPVPIENINLEWEMNENTIKVDKFNFDLAAGHFGSTFQTNYYLTQPEFFAKFHLDRIKIEKLLDQKQWPFRLEANLRGEGHLQGLEAPGQTLAGSMEGKSTFELKEAVLKDFNLLKQTIRSLSVFDGFVEEIEFYLPEYYKEMLKNKDTPIKDVHLKFNIAGEKATIESLTFNAQGFIFLAAGSLDFNQILLLESYLYLAADLSKSMTIAEPELTALLDEHQQIRIPFKKYQGPLSEFKSLKPELAKIFNQVLKSKAKDEAQKALRKVFGNDQQPPADGANPQKTPSSKSPEEALIESIFKQISIFD